MERPEPALRTVTRAIQGATVVEFRGAIDLESAPEVRRHLDAAGVRGHSPLIIDLRLVSFLGSDAAEELCRLHRMTVEPGGRLVVICAHRFTLRVLNAAGVGPLLKIVATMLEALTAVRQAQPNTHEGQWPADEKPFRPGPMLRS
ncbi:STAS domain-containing protein [Streptomyces sp. 21So2-11]|uniref:STAS domain-containing protein n=1 Tax=Streptomyces sp. 21So2-11 TaxID=3144408 RepID=UPI00321AA81D